MSALAAELLDIACGSLEPGLAAGEQRDVRAVFREPARGGAADPARRAGDDDNLAHG